MTYTTIRDYGPKTMSKLAEAYKESLDQGERHRDVFDWPSATLVLDKVIEEANELKEAIVSQNGTETFTEASDLVFTVVQCLRHLKLDLSDCLDYSNKKFQIRFDTMSKIAGENDVQLKDLNLSELEELWKQAKIVSTKSINTLNKDFKL